jgi:molybdopterin molybdotransferase
MTPSAATPHELSSVRMRGFAARAGLDEAWAWLDARIEPLGSETVEPFAAVGRITGGDIVAAGDLPIMDRAARDGYAIRAADSVGASDYNPIPLGSLGPLSPVSAGDAVPEGTDAIVAVEHTRSDAGTVELVAAVAEGEGIERRGDDITAGTILLPAGRLIRPVDAALLTALGVADIPVVRRPVIRLAAVGSELEPSTDLDTPMLAALVARDGGIAERHPPLPDDAAAIREFLARPGADLVILCGGSGLGTNDRTAEALTDAGTLAIHGIALRPADSISLGDAAGISVAVLPGRPASCLCAYEIVAGRAVRRLAGGSADLPFVRRPLTTARKIVSPGGWADFCRVRITADGRVEPLGSGGNTSLSSVVRADGFVLVPAAQEGFPAGSAVPVHLFAPSWKD